MRSFFLLPFLVLFAQTKMSADILPFVNPTGTYLLRGEIKKNHITGHFGEMRVQLLDSQTVAFCMYISNGYPDYTSAAMMDTLQYEENAIHYKPRHDSTCSLILTFSFSSVEIMSVITDPHSGCGFTPGIVIPATFKKISSETPLIQDLSQRGQQGR